MTVFRNKPIADDSITVITQFIRENQMALIDMIGNGVAIGMNYTRVVGTGMVEKPEYFLLTDGSHHIRFTPTYGTTGGEQYNIVSGTVERSDDGGSVWATIKTFTNTWHTNGYLLATTWS